MSAIEHHPGEASMAKAEIGEVETVEVLDELEPEPAEEEEAAAAKEPAEAKSYLGSWRDYGSSLLWSRRS